MLENFSSEHKAYLAGFLDGDGSIYARLKPNKTYRFGFQIAAYIVFFQSVKNREKFEKVCSLFPSGTMRERNDGMLEYIIQRREALDSFLDAVTPFLIQKQEQAKLLREILDTKDLVENKQDFVKVVDLIQRFERLNFSKRRKQRMLTP